MSATKRCFVISPIGDEGSEIRHHADDVFEFIIEPAMEPFGIDVVRSDHMSETGQITEQMFGQILEADLCVAVLTGHNANVFYELAVAQCAARPLILLIEKGQRLPFDVKDQRAIEYRLSPIGDLVKGVYRDRVREQVESIRASGWAARGIFEEYKFPRLRSERQVRRTLRAAEPRPLPPGKAKHYALPSGQEIVILTGDVKELRGPDEPGGHKIDAIVSLENTFLQLGRYYDRSISGSLRYMDAEKSAGEIKNDSLNDGLQSQLKKLPVRLGSVIATPTTQLRADLGIRYVLHVAAMHGSVGDGYKMISDVIDDCVRNAFRRFAEMIEEDESAGLESILFPMLGAASADIDIHEVAHQLLWQVVDKMQRIPACRTVYVLAWLESHCLAIQKVAKELELEEIEPGDADDPEARARRPRIAA